MSFSLPAGSDDPQTVGSNAWASAGGPPLTLRQILAQLLAAGGAYLSGVPGELRWVLSSRGLFPEAHVDEIGLRGPPETAAVEAAMKQLEHYAEGEREVLNHSYRTFHFADILYRQHGAQMPIDREVLAVAMLLHDVGIYPRAAAELPGGDFTVRGAHLARRILGDAGWNRDRINLAAQAISLNANGRVTSHWGAEAYFGRLAPLVDVVGQCWKIHPKDAQRLFARYPARDLPRSILGYVAAEVGRHPRSRFTLYAPFFPFLVMNCECRWHRRIAGLPPDDPV